MTGDRDAVVVGAGPNGLAAAITLAREGYGVQVLEAGNTVGGGARSAELTLPGFVHDVCASVFPLGLGSPFFRTLPLERHGLRWVHPELPLAHPFDREPTAVLHRSLHRTAAGLEEDRTAYLDLMGPVLRGWRDLEAEVLGPVGLPRHPVALARFGLRALRPLQHLAEERFQGHRARALLAGIAAHSFLPLDRWGSSAFALVLGVTGHHVGWPFAQGGAQALSDALAAHLRELGGEIVTDRPVDTLQEVRRSRVVLLDVTPRQLLRMAGPELPGRYRRALERYRYGPGAYKVDWALDGPIPWADPVCGRAGTVHLGGRLEEIAASERASWEGRPPESPYVLLAQPSLFDPGRAPAGHHTAWAYCHVPHASRFRMVERIEAQVERFAPGFRKRILRRSVRPPEALERDNPNLVGGDINGGSAELPQVLRRPTLRQYATPLPGVYLCSSSTPPGGGVHGMGGHLAARLAVRYLRGGRGTLDRDG